MPKLGYFEDENGNGNFRIFAPFCKTLAIEIDRTHEHFELNKQDDGYFTTTIRALKKGSLYWLVKNGTEYLPDPNSKYQPFDVHSASMITKIEKADFSQWTGIDYKDAIIYELHLGTFSEEGNLKGAQKHLNYIKSLGINVIELMPICQFPGDRNWGYDGTYMFALCSSYGTYEDLKEFLDKAHSLGIAVILDVVYNHFGPEGNYSGMIAPFTKQADTPWGAAINFDKEWNNGIRDFYLENTRYWLSEIGFDGFRMDAVALIMDESNKNILTEINELASEISKKENRKIIMIAEHLRNETKVTSPTGYKYQAQWCDDLNYSIYSYLTNEKFRHYNDFGKFEDIKKALEEGFVYNGTKLNSVYNNYMGDNGANILPETLVTHIQNHDQIGNRPNGDRMSATYGITKALLSITLVFCSPYTPMIFMGEEYAEINPFLFFESFSDESLIEAVKNGRKREFSFVENHEPKAPHDVQTFIDSKLDWECQSDAPHSLVLEYYKRLIALKKSKIIGIHNRANINMGFDKINKIITIETPKSISVFNFGTENYLIPDDIKMLKILLSSKIENNNNYENTIASFSCNIYAK
jgi:maltooligosyltrehalose trehalohydrolase